MESFEEFKRRLYTSQIDFDQLANWYWQEHQGVSETVVHRSQYDQMCEGFERRIRALEQDLEKTDDKEVEILDQIRDALCDIQRNPDRCCRILQGILDDSKEPTPTRLTKPEPPPPKKSTPVFEDVLMRNQNLAMEIKNLRKDLELSEERIVEILDEVNYAKHHVNDSTRCFQILRGILGED